MKRFAPIILVVLSLIIVGCTDSDQAVQPSAQNANANAADSGFNLYGRTINDTEFDWNSLRGKYVLVKFTATWCPPCQMEIPGMKAVYEQYRDKDFAIVSVYVFQREADPVATVRDYVAAQELPWIILSEELTRRAGQPPQGETFEIRGVPTMLLVDREGEVIARDTRTMDQSLQRKLAELLGE